MSIQEQIKKFDMLFDPIFGDLDIIMLSKKLSNGKYGFTYQSNLTSRYLIGRLWKYLRSSWLAISLYGLAIQVAPSIMNMHIKRLMGIYGKPKFVALVSKGQAEILGVDSWGVPYFILNPANAVDPELLNHRGVGKDDYLVFYARMHPEKGIFELPKIIKILRDEYDGDVKLKVMGAFPNDGIRRVFFSLVRRYGVENNIKYLGFVNEEEKHEIVAKAKVLIYPSHSDWFSLVILESLTRPMVYAASSFNTDIPNTYLTRPTGQASIDRDNHTLKVVQFNIIKHFSISTRVGLNRYNPPSTPQGEVDGWIAPTPSQQ
jgi:glycosyltransferase involved in cell wall biosynthesis